MRVVLGALILLLADFSDSEGWHKNFNINQKEQYSKTRFLVAKQNYHNRLPKPAPRITEWDELPTSTIPPYSMNPSPSSLGRENIAKYRKLLKKERSKLRKSLKNSKVRENKNTRSSILGRINEINAEIRKYPRKNAKHRQRKRKHKKHGADVNRNNSNILEVTTARNKNFLRRWNLNDDTSLNKVIQELNRNPEINFSNETSNDLKIYGGPVRFNSTSFNGDVHKFGLNDASDYRNDRKIAKNNIISTYHALTVRPQSANLKNKTSSPHTTVMPMNSISIINYADLMKVQTTTMPPVKNVSLDAILKEFNIISNQIGVLLPGRQKYPDFNLTKNAESYRRKKTRCSFKKGGCEHVCHPKGPRQCSCLKGFKLAVNKRQCLDINECLIKNGGCINVCHNTPGSYYCSCSTGLRLSDDGKSCEDINECLLRNGHGPCQDTCKNTYGSYECFCTGLNGTRLGADKHSCEDVDECTEGRSGCSHGCVNTLGRAYCICPEGMELSSDWKACKDVDECDDNEGSKCKFGCINTIGSYFCTDDFDMQSDQSASPIPDHVACPPLFPPHRGFLECSREKGLRVKMKSRSGRMRVTNRPGTFCHLVCPAGHRLVGLFQVICALNGRWMGDKSGTCLDN